MTTRMIAFAILVSRFWLTAEAVPTSRYRDQRPAATLRLNAEDQGMVLSYGDGPNQCDYLGAREAVVFEDNGNFYLHYDGAGPRGWRACLATSHDLVHWAKRGPVLDLGEPGSLDSAAAVSPWVIKDQGVWHMFYVGTPHASSPPNQVPMFPYLTMKARSAAPQGPWEKQYACIPFRPQPNTYYAATASPGCVIKYHDEFLMYFSASVERPKILRTLGLATTRDLNGAWSVAEQPLFPLEEQIENSAIYYEKTNDTWFLFTNHIGLNDKNEEYTDAIWVYWSHDPRHWVAAQKAIVLDGTNCKWSQGSIGMPSLIQVGDRLALFYDGAGGTNISDMQRKIGLAWLKLPLTAPSLNGSQ